jgi:hypothetical protein
MQHSHLIASVSPDHDSIWLHANAEHGPEYTDDRTTTIEMKWISEPTVNVYPETSIVTYNWDEKNGILSLKLSHSNGSIEAEITQ